MKQKHLRSSTTEMDPVNTEPGIFFTDGPQSKPDEEQGNLVDVQNQVKNIRLVSVTKRDEEPVQKLTNNFMGEFDMDLPPPAPIQESAQVEPSGPLQPQIKGLTEEDLKKRRRTSQQQFRFTGDGEQRQHLGKVKKADSMTKKKINEQPRTIWDL